MTDIKSAFQNGKAFIPFVTAGDPDLETTEKLLIEMSKNGADIIEIGIPHEISGSISWEIVAQNFVRGVISEAHVPGNDRIIFYSVVCGRLKLLAGGLF